MTQTMSDRSGADPANDGFAAGRGTKQRRTIKCLLCACFLLTATGGIAAAPSIEILRELPARGVLRLGEVIYVDDGECPPGEVKKIVGGSQKAGVARQVTCVKRPKTPPES